MMKRLILAISLGIIIFLSWYFFIKKSEFEVNFRVKTLPGNVIQRLALWNQSLPNTEALIIDSTTMVVQKLRVHEKSFVYTWNFERVNDSLTAVNIQISEPQNALLNKILVPFGTPAVEEEAARLTKEFYDVLMAHLDLTKVKVVGRQVMPEYFCACVNLKKQQLDKANGMMQVYNDLVSFVETNQLAVNGKPIIDINYWDHNSGRLVFDFCFPIVSQVSVKAERDFFFKQIPSTDAIMAVYNGNYITSDRAWYALLNYANQQSLEVKGFPKEIFYNNPNMGMNEVNWKAEIYLPIK
jgi:effector-binding domain-containing protein